MDRTEYQRRYYRERVKAKRSTGKIDNVRQLRAVDQPTLFDTKLTQQPAVESTCSVVSLNSSQLSVLNSTYVENSTPCQHKVPWSNALVALSGLGICAVLTAFLTHTAQRFYADDVGEVWGWLLAGTFELAILLLSMYHPRGRIVLKTASDAVDSLSTLVKLGFSKLFLVGLAVYSFNVVTVNVDIRHADRVSTVANEQVADLQEELELTRQALEQHIKAGAVGAISRTQAAMEALRTQMATLQTSSVSTGMVAAETRRADTQKLYRAMALAINILFGHIIAGWAFSRRREGLISA